jgi:hypothetical protein
MIKAHVTSVRVHGALVAASRTAGDTVDAGTGTGTTVAVTTRTAAPIDTVIRVATAKAPTRPTHLLYPIVISSPAAPPVDAWDIAHSERSATCLPKPGMCKAQKFRNPDSAQQSILVGKHRRITNLRFRQ